jgi:hypothetical protein
LSASQTTENSSYFLGKGQNQIIRTMSITIDNRPVFSLTITEDNLRITNVVKTVLAEYNLMAPATPVIPLRTKINGIRGLASYLEVSVPTAQRLKNSRRFPFYESGNKVFMYSDEVNAGLKVNAKEVGLSKKLQK